MIKNLFFLGCLLVTPQLFAQTVVFEENFDTPERQALWTIGDLDGDEDTWEFVDAVEAEAPSFSGYFAWSWSWFFGALKPDNTLTSPVFKIPEGGKTELTFKVSAADNEEGFYEEHYAVYVIPANSTFTGSETPVFEETLDGGYFDTAKIVNVDISDYANEDVQLVFRHYNCSDILYIGLDDVKITQEKLSTSDINKESIVVYQDNSFVKISGVKNVKKIKVFDVTGKFVLEVNQSEANISTLPKGIYIVNFYSGDNVISRKIVKK
ncbi:T9SS-dependent choice-of-anchor J family protein [Empedobacter tilapiae]|uniref:T9SS-dependent choice-of-anchor J family protein n=1 Tax=Empedobacter tilapiae TaxID=2491114 RepID=UPI0028D527BF|nr:choice-of-anchor J domain-containing protein [Empedobacter tilapiae]